MKVKYGSWSLNGKSPSAIIDVQLDPPKLTLKCVAVSKELGGVYDDPLDEIKVFQGLRRWNVESVELLNGGTFVWGDRRHSLLEVKDGTHTYYGALESVKWGLDGYSDEIIEYELNLVLELPSNPGDFFNYRVFGDGFDPSVFQGGSSP